MKIFSIPPRFYLFVFTYLLYNSVFAQKESIPFNTIALKDLSGFKSPPTNWKTAGDVFMDREKNLSVKSMEGNGILLNFPSGNSNQNLVTNLEHEIIDLEFNFMLSKGSRSGIFLQGRYELQLADSWGLHNSPSVCGGLDDNTPRLNACKAPGLWQTCKISFNPPRFNTQGVKISDACFLKVVLNGSTIHENIFLSKPSLKALLSDEKGAGPLVFQSELGPVAFRNIRYKVYKNKNFELDEMFVKWYNGWFMKVSEIVDVLPKQKSNPTKIITWEYTDGNSFGINYEGQMKIKEAGNFNFELHSIGPSILEIDHKVVIDQNELEQYTSKASSVYLTSGIHSFSLTYYKFPYIKPLLGLFVEGPGVQRQALHEPSSMFQGSATPPIIIQPGNRPSLLRSFVMHQGKKRTHCLSLGSPKEINYTYDLNQGILLKAWKGAFVDVTGMWSERGLDQLAVPMDEGLEFMVTPSVAILDNKQAVWPDSVSIDDYEYKGYKIDSSGYPVFKYKIAGGEIEDQIIPARENKILVREFRTKNINSSNKLWCRLAKGKNIAELKDGAFQIDDKTYYIEVEKSSGQALIRKTGNTEELIIPFAASKNGLIKYNIIW